jgi:hypothetical protein
MQNIVYHGKIWVKAQLLPEKLHEKAAARTPAHNLAATQSRITRRDDRELQTKQTIVGLPARNA